MYKEVSEERHQKLSLADSAELNENINRDRQYVRIIRRVVNSECSCPSDGYCAPFNKKELDASLAQLKNTSPGDDQIHNKLLTHIPPCGKMALLTLFNRVYKSGQYPAAWRKRTVIPILKVGKDPAFMSSYRPIQLTSCLGVEGSLCADDLALFAQNEDLEQASSLLQQGLECIEKWAKKWKMTLNVDKCEVTHFSKWTKEASWRPNVKLLDRRLKYSDSSPFLGVTF
ncbi:RNA-directed DNA polymerase from mobile element jockey, partial [Elysia marginata]